MENLSNAMKKLQIIKESVNIGDKVKISNSNDLHNGKEGKVTYIDDKIITVKLDNGRSFNYDKNQVQKIQEDKNLITEDEEASEEIRNAYYERTKKRVEDYANKLDLTPLFNWLKELTGIKDLKFEIKRGHDGSTPTINWESQNIVDKVGVMRFAFKDVRLESFGNAVTTTAPSWYSDKKVDYTKDYDLYYWVSVHFGYEHVDGGANGAKIGNAVCKEGKWEFSLTKDRN